MDNSDKVKKVNKKLNTAMISLAVIFFLLFLFGISCNLSKYISVRQNNQFSVFGLSVISAIDFDNSLNGDNRVVIDFKSKNSLKVGDKIAYIERDTNYCKIGKVENLDNDLVIKSFSDNKIISIDYDSVYGVVVNNNSFVCGFIQFLLSNWVLWIFIVIPSFALMIFILYAILSRLEINEFEDKKEPLKLDFLLMPAKPVLLLLEHNEIYQKENVKNSQIELDINNLLNSFEDKNIQNKVTKKRKRQQNKHQNKNLIPDKIDDNLQIKFDFSGIKVLDKNTKKPTQKLVKKDNKNFVKQKPIKENHIKINTSINNKTIKTYNYVYEKLPSNVVDTPIKDNLNKITHSSKNFSYKTDLLEKMRRERRGA